MPSNSTAPTHGKKLGSLSTNGGPPRQRMRGFGTSKRIVAQEFRERCSVSFGGLVEGLHSEASRGDYGEADGLCYWARVPVTFVEDVSCTGEDARQ